MKKVCHIYKKYREKGYKAEDANRMANYELIRKYQGIDMAEKYLQNEKNKSLGYYKDATGRWHRPDGKYASNAEVGLLSSKKRKEVQRQKWKEYTGNDPKGEVHHGLPEQFSDWFSSK